MFAHNIVISANIASLLNSLPSSFACPCYARVWRFRIIRNERKDRARVEFRRTDRSSTPKSEVIR